MPTRKSQVVIITPLFTFLILALVACGGAEEAPITVPEGAQAGDLVGLEACSYEANDIEYEADCGTLVVPENRSNPDSRLIALPVIRIHALNDNGAEPIFYFTGGPGGSNMHFQSLQGLVDDHDFVQVGYRGVDGSEFLDCPEIAEAIRNARELLSDEMLESYTAAGARCAERLQAEGVDLAGYTIAETIDDADEPRRLESVNLLAASDQYLVYGGPK